MAQALSPANRFFHSFSRSRFGNSFFLSRERKRPVPLTFSQHKAIVANFASTSEAPAPHSSVALLVEIAFAVGDPVGGRFVFEIVTEPRKDAPLIVHLIGFFAQAVILAGVLE